MRKNSKPVHLVFLTAALLVGCSGKPNRVEATITGNAGKYIGFPVCLEVSFASEQNGGSYPEDLCSPAPVTGRFDVTLNGAADNLAEEIFSASGPVFLRANTMEIAGIVTNHTEIPDGDTMKIVIGVEF